MEFGPKLDSRGGAMVVYDAAGTVIEANQAAVDILATTAEELIGSSAADAGWLVTDAAGRLRADHLHPALAAIRTGQPQLRVLVCLAGPGPDIWMQVDAIPDPSNSGRVSRVTASLTDVTHIMFHDSRGSAHRVMSTVAAGVAGARLDPEAILSAMTASLSATRRGTWIATLMDRDPGTVRVVAANAAHPEMARYLEQMHRSGASATGVADRVIDTGEPILMPRISFAEFMRLQGPHVPEYVSAHEPPMDAPGHLGVLVVPMRAHNAIVGTLGLFEDRASYPLTERDLSWVQEVADSAGLAVDNAQRYEDAVSRLRRLESLRKIGLAISSNADLRLTMQVVVDQVSSLLGVDAADVLIVDESADVLTLAASTGFQSSSIPDYRLSIAEGLPGHVLATRQIEVMAGEAAFSGFRRRSLFAREGFQAYCAAPLIVSGKPVGVLEIFHRSPLKLDQEWLSFLDAVGSEAAMAIAYASLASRLERLGPGGGRSSNQPAPDLSPLQKEILGHVVEGHTNQEIAEMVHRSPHTVKFHVSQILDKVGVSNRTEMASKARKEGWF